MSVIYVLDTNVLIQAYRNYYSFDLAPGFWDSLAEFAARIRVIDWVRSEMVDEHDDELAQWVRGAGAVLCQPVMELDNVRSAVVAEYQAIARLVQITPRFKANHYPDRDNFPGSVLTRYTKGQLRQEDVDRSACGMDVG